ncbi:polynucleotide 5'-hydroxyl-kinase NOL9-like [Limulus polyphemus]|uniref:Polynucleotide 5'-hydroxyl-kinase NOL9 n=1 Tax=Limulus polyphemus TaxID=6850 RepID=A0ABM1BUJ0_LIMPO|nr:polynucleotide 5'-hydroxyl-kinase NOL9-like [Limulus polyphemus]
MGKTPKQKSSKSSKIGNFFKKIPNEMKKKPWLRSFMGRMTRSSSGKTNLSHSLVSKECAGNIRRLSYSFSEEQPFSTTCKVEKSNKIKDISRNKNLLKKKSRTVRLPSSNRSIQDIYQGSFKMNSEHSNPSPGKSKLSKRKQSVKLYQPLNQIPFPYSSEEENVTYISNSDIKNTPKGQIFVTGFDGRKEFANSSPKSLTYNVQKDDDDDNSIESLEEYNQITHVEKLLVSSSSEDDKSQTDDESSHIETQLHPCVDDTDSSEKDPKFSTDRLPTNKNHKYSGNEDEDISISESDEDERILDIHDAKLYTPCDVEIVDSPSFAANQGTFLSPYGKASETSESETSEWEDLPSFMQNSEMSYTENGKLVNDENENEENKNMEDAGVIFGNYEDEQQEEGNCKQVTSIHSVKSSQKPLRPAKTDHRPPFHIFPLPSSNTVIAVLHHPTQVLMYGKALVRVLSGSLNILGHSLSSQCASFFPVFSGKCHSYIGINTETVEAVPVGMTVKRHLVQRLAQEDLESLASKVSSVFDSFSVLIVLKKLPTFKEVEYVTTFTKKLFVPAAVHDPRHHLLVLPNHKKYGFSLTTKDERLKFIPEQDYENLAGQIMQEILKSKRDGLGGPCIIVCGGKNTGKSSLIRYLMNSALNVCSEVMHLEADPGQTEFTPPGCVAVTRVCEPLFGPPFTHQKTPERMSFVGTVDLQNAPDLYSESVQQIHEWYKENFNEVPLFINTMGWNVGIGLSLLVDILRHVQPDIVIQMKVKLKSQNLPDLTPEFLCTACGWRSNREVYENSVPYFQYQRIVLSPPLVKARPNVAAPVLRSMAVMAYLGKLQNSVPYILPLNSFTPFRVSWATVAVHVCEDNVPVNHILYALNGSLVALCRVDSSQMKQPEDPSFPKLLPKTLVNECFGFGVVRAIDPVNKTFFIITPEPLSRLQKVNALLRGSVNLPEQIIKEQGCNVALPYVSKLQSHVPYLPRLPIKPRVWKERRPGRHLFSKVRK